MDNSQRSCAWMSGPKDPTVTVSAAKWWYAISRDVFSKMHRNQQPPHRAISRCQRTPKFVSPLARR